MAACRVTNNYISNCRGHGVVTRASGGTISGNTIVGVTYGAIELAPTFNAVEGAFIKDTVVRLLSLTCLNDGPWAQRGAKNEGRYGNPILPSH